MTAAPVPPKPTPKNLMEPIRQWLPTLVVLALMLLVVGLPLVFRSQAGGAEVADGPNAPKLVLYTPHNEQIRHEFARAFNHWRQERGEPQVFFDWRAPGGTSDQRRIILDQFKHKADMGKEDEGIGADMFFGGGTYDHGKLSSGITVKRDGEEVRIPVSVAPELPDGLIAEVFPSDSLGGEPLYHPELRWIGVVLSSFGIVYNRDVLNLIEVPEPTTWQDLADPRLQHWVALADPGHSGSITATYNTILQRLGWQRGWHVLRRCYANARYFSAGSSKVPVDVSSGEAAVGMCIDFYGRYQAGAIGGDRVDYVDPEGLTAITADPISVLRGAPNYELASEFVKWLLLPGAQHLWQKGIGSEGGPERFELRRVPIRRDVYGTADQADWVDELRPFEIAQPLPEGTPNYFGLVAPIAHAMAIDIHDELKAAWAAIQNNPDHPRHDEMLELFDAMPEAIDLDVYLDNPQTADAATRRAAADELAGSVYGRWDDRDQRLKDRLDWTAFFTENYREIVRIANE